MKRALKQAAMGFSREINRIPTPLYYAYLIAVILTVIEPML